MLVKDWMTRNVITIDADDSMQDALRIIKENEIRMLPVLKNGKLAGIVTDRDLKRASASDATTLEVHELLYLISHIKVRDIMTQYPIAVDGDSTVEETARILLKHKISGAPVVDPDGVVVGVITQTELFKIIISLIGTDQKGFQFALEIEDKSGAVTDLIDVIRKHQGRIISVLSSRDLAPKGHRRVYIRFFDIERNDIDNLKTDLMQKSRLIYFVDQMENTQTIV
jgi:acetoin utilization protein AcuB